MPDEKMTKREAGYIEHPRRDQSLCCECSMYHAGGQCSLVMGQIHFAATCNHFEARTDQRKP